MGSYSVNGKKWSVNGNKDIDIASQFLGMIDAKDLVFKTNDVERLRIKSTGEIGIKKAIPTALLDIEENIEGNAVIKLAHVISGLLNHATIKLQTEGSEGGDPRIKFNIKGVADGTWSIGVDNSDLDTFKISRGSTLESNTYIKIDKDGKVFINQNLEVGSDFSHIGAKIGFFGAAPVIQSAEYTSANVTTDRSYDANSTSIDEIADVLGTLISDLKLLGIIK